MDDNRQIEQANQGRVAHWLNERIEPYLSKMENDLIVSLKSIYRDETKEINNSILLAKIAGLCVIEDLRIKLNQDIKLGGVAQEELIR